MQLFMNFAQIEQPFPGREHPSPEQPIPGRERKKRLKRQKGSEADCKMAKSGTKGTPEWNSTRRELNQNGSNKPENLTPYIQSMMLLFHSKYRSPHQAEELQPLILPELSRWLFHRVTVCSQSKEEQTFHMNKLLLVPGPGARISLGFSLELYAINR